MTFTCRTFASGNAWPCDLDVSVDAVAVVAAAFAVAVVALGFFALVYALTIRKT